MRAVFLIAWEVLAGAAACGRLGFEATSADQDGSNGTGDGAILQATAVHFSSAEGDYLSNGSLAGAVDSPRATASVWIRFTGPDGVPQEILTAMLFVPGGLERTTSNDLRIVLMSCSGAATLLYRSNATATAASGWLHILVSFDTAAATLELYLNDSRDTTTGAGGPEATCWTASQWGLGGLTGATLDADVAEVYFAPGVYLDLTQVANRRLFEDAQGRPVELGPNCEVPTGAPPLLCLRGDAAGWHVNKGTGGGFTLNGNGLAQVGGP